MEKVCYSEKLLLCGHCVYTHRPVIPSDTKYRSEGDISLHT